MCPASSPSVLFCLHRSQETGLNWVLPGDFRMEVEPPGHSCSTLRQSAGPTATSHVQDQVVRRGEGGGPAAPRDGGRGTGRATFRLSVTFLFISLLLSPQWQVRRIYWNCITETCGSQNPQAPRSASCTGRCRAETRTVPPSLERGLRYGPTCVLKGPRLLCWEWSAGPKSGSRGQEESSRGSLDRAGVEGVRSGCIPNAFQTRS